jgi:hypothetical protein
MFGAMEDQDIDAFLDLMDPVAVEEALGGLSFEEAREDLGAEMFGSETYKFSGIKMSTEKTGATTATVTIVEGTVTVTDANGVTASEDVAAADSPVTFDVVQRDGVWYLDPGSMFGV